jgi:hypothetical protein
VGERPTATFSLLFRSQSDESAEDLVKLPAIRALLATNESADAACSVQATVIRLFEDEGSKRLDVELDLRPNKKSLIFSCTEFHYKRKIKFDSNF